MRISKPIMSALLILISIAQASVSNALGELKITASDAAEIHFFGWAVAMSGDTAIIGAFGVGAGGDHPGAAYIFVRDENTWIEQAKLIPSDAEKAAHFGEFVAISGDYVIVGAPEGERVGSAYIFVRSGNIWIEQAKLLPDDLQAGDPFGIRVAISGSVAVVGNPGNDSGGTNSGAAFVFVRDGNSWIQQTKLTASDAQEQDFFGRSVAISGEAVIVGAHHDNNNAGAAYIFVRNGNSWIQQAKLTASDAAPNNEFGSEVSINEEVALVGTPGDDDGGSASGSAYIFVRNGNSWTQQAKLTASDAVQGDTFGAAVSISGVVAIVGAYQKDDAGDISGAAYIFVRNGKNWAEQAKLTASDAARHDLFGISVATNGEAAIVGAGRDDAGGMYSGSAYVYGPIQADEKPSAPWDVNADGGVDIFDLVFIASQFGEPHPDLRADVNGDGIIDIFDLVAVASHFGENTAR